jgi:hypothetical protein
MNHGSISVRINIIIIIIIIIIITETIQHITEASEQLAPTKYVKRHDGGSESYPSETGRSS